MESLRDRHKNETVWIIGKGPSLQYLKRDDIGQGPVITLNAAILAVEPICLPNPIYSMQKDGGNRRKPSKDNLCPDCDFTGECGEACGGIVRPETATLLLHDLESKYCFPDYSPRHVLNLQELGLHGNAFSLIFAIKTAQYMGCNKFNFVSCDAHSKNDNRTYVPGKGTTKSKLSENLYQGQRMGLKPFLEGLDCQWITPNGVEVETDLSISFGVIVNDIQRLDMCLKQSQIPGEMHYIKTPDSATKGLNKLLDIIEAEGAQIAILTHQDMFYRQGWIEQVKSQIALLPDNWIVAGIIGKDNQGRICGKLHDMRIPLHFNTSHIHTFPHPACCFDECCIIVNMKSGFRFDETMQGFDLYGTLCVLQAWEMGGTAWVIDAFAEHYCMRPFSWAPDKPFISNYKLIHDRFSSRWKVDSTALGFSPDPKESGEQEKAFMTSAQ